jgi:hypothetical protein
MEAETMRKKNDAIWYDWNSSSGFELMEIENQRMNEQVDKRKAAQIIELKHFKKVACTRKCNGHFKQAL